MPDPTLRSSILRKCHKSMATKTSGMSANINRAFQAAREIGLMTVGFSGRDGGRMPEFSGYCFNTGGWAVLYVGHSASQDSASTALDVYDLSTAASPKLTGSASFRGDVCSLLPSGSHLLVQDFGFGRLDHGVYTALPGASPHVTFAAAGW